MRESRRVGLSAARTELADLIDDAERGYDVVITRRGMAIARIVPVFEGRTVAEAAADRMLRGSRGRTLGGLKIKDLIEEGRS